MNFQLSYHELSTLTVISIGKLKYIDVIGNQSNLPITFHTLYVQAIVCSTTELYRKDEMKREGVWFDIPSQTSQN